MTDYKWLAKLGGEGYAEVIEKIDKFNDSSAGRFPETVEELDFTYSLAESDLEILNHRGQLERKLNKIQKPKLLLVRTHNQEDGESLSDDNQIIFTDFGYKLDDFVEKDNLDLGLFLINNDIIKREKNHGLRGFGTNARIIYVRPKHKKKQLIKPNGNNSGTLTLPFYKLKEVYCTSDDILNYCKKLKLTKINIERIENLVSNAAQDYLSKVENSRIGITPHEVDILYSEFIGGGRSWKEVFSQAFS